MTTQSSPSSKPVQRAGARVTSLLLHPAAKPLLFVLCLLPLAYLIFAAVTNGLGANPAEALIRSLGDWSLRGLWLTLCITPARVISGQPALLRFRRMLGVFTFFYVCLHLLAYGWLDMSLDLSQITADIAKRTFILLGFIAWVLLIPLAATSFNKAIKSLGPKRWQALHKLVYLISLLGLAHFIWMRAGKNNFTEPAIYGAILMLLLGWRMWQLRSRRKGRPAA